MSKPVIEDLFSMRGRRNRLSYFLYSLLNLISIALLVLALSESISSGYDVGVVIAGVAVIPIVFSSWMVGAQRCRDFGWTGWAVLLMLIPYLGFLFMLALLFIPGTRGDNRFGRDPRISDDRAEIAV